MRGMRRGTYHQGVDDCRVCASLGLHRDCTAVYQEDGDGLARSGSVGQYSLCQRVLHARQRDLDSILALCLHIEGQAQTKDDGVGGTCRRQSSGEAGGRIAGHVAAMSQGRGATSCVIGRSDSLKGRLHAVVLLKA